MDEPQFAERGFNFFHTISTTAAFLSGSAAVFRFEHEPPVLSLLMNCDLPWNLDYLDKEV